MNYSFTTKPPDNLCEKTYPVHVDTRHFLINNRLFFSMAAWSVRTGGTSVSSSVKVFCSCHPSSWVKIKEKVSVGGYGRSSILDYVPVRVNLCII